MWTEFSWAQLWNILIGIAVGLIAGWAMARHYYLRSGRGQAVIARFLKHEVGAGRTGFLLDKSGQLTGGLEHRVAVEVKARAKVSAAATVGPSGKHTDSSIAGKEDG